MAKRRKKKPDDMLRMKWSPEYQQQELSQQLAQLLEQEGFWETHVKHLVQALRVARKQVREAQQGQEKLRAVVAAGWPMFEQRV